jgi:hypothetical protein
MINTASTTNSERGAFMSANKADEAKPTQPYNPKDPNRDPNRDPSHEQPDKDRDRDKDKDKDRNDPHRDTTTGTGAKRKAKKDGDEECIDPLLIQTPLA